METENYLQEIRKNKGLSHAILKKIAIDEGKNQAEFFLITDSTYTQQEAENAASISQKFVDENIKASVRIAKLIPDEKLLVEEIKNILSSRFPAASAFVSKEDIHVEKDEVGARFFIDITAGEQTQFTSGEILDYISKQLQSRFCGGFYGNVKIVEKVKEVEQEKKVQYVEEYIPAPRFFPVVEYSAIDGGEKPKDAIYLADCDSESENMTICGSISYLKEKETSKGKPFFIITLSDGTGNLRISYFTKKNTLEKIRNLKVGDFIVCNGANQFYREDLMYTAKNINYGRPPVDFVPVKRQSKSVPIAYKTVLPQPFSDYTQANLFGDSNLPADLKNNTFVVFDLETTGLNNIPAGGNMDKIIEIGAVKMKNGEICERFSSFIACDRNLSEEIVALTGITDEMLKGAPPIEKVIADFYKFTDGCFLVGHNVMFDYRFIRYYGEQEDYIFEQKTYDTLSLAQELLRLSNNKLNTVADYFGITFNHHRAFDDALATAKIFIQLIKMKKCLPN